MTINNPDPGSSLSVETRTRTMNLTHSVPCGTRPLEVLGGQTLEHKLACDSWRGTASLNGNLHFLGCKLLFEFYWASTCAGKQTPLVL